MCFLASGEQANFYEELLPFWHSYRLYVFLFAGIAIALFRLYRARYTKERPASPLDVSEKAAPPTKSPSLPIVKPEPPVTTTTQARSPSPKSKSKLKQKTVEPKRVRGARPAKTNGKRSENSAGTFQQAPIRPLIFFSSLTGTTEARAKWLESHLLKESEKPFADTGLSLLPPELHDLSYIDFDDYFITAPKPTDASPNARSMYCILLPTYNIDTVINNFLGHLDETHNDFRIDTAPLSGLAGYSVFGFGDKEGWPTEEEGFCSQAREVDRWMAKLTGRKRAFPLGLGDVKSDPQKALNEWSDGLLEVMKDLMVNGGLGEGVPGSGDPLESDEEEDIQEGDSSNKKGQKKKDSSQVMDLEDIKINVSQQDGPGASGPSNLPIDFTTSSKKATAPQPQQPKEMVPTTSPTHTALTKQGYTIVGSHSGVKICRWTKSALRGRGSCYKNSFYGIKSHLCMETTPSLSCSNKCVFCWRHGTNPVGTTWRWKVDPPDMIFNGVKEGHYKKIKMLRGVPGVRAERFSEAMRIRHCALSLVGEPIFYPHINEFVGLLHSEQISSFLVCNAQHPDQLAALDRVTQLYVSIDASDRDSLRKIDRPLHRDFWERFQRCLDILREKTHIQRTVYRLTLVKGFNIEDEARGYADLVEKGLPCFVEVKGVTYCGTSTSAGAGLSMKNVPFYEEVAAFVVALNQELSRRGLAYGIAAEHSHSCCILLASYRFFIDGRWHTRINYDKFFELLERERQEGISFKPEDYTRETEEWALWGNGGFDPNDQRVYRNRKNKAEPQSCSIDQQPVSNEITTEA